MAKKSKCPPCPAGEKWAVPYADFLSLLLALFIALWAISENNPTKTEALKTEFVKIFDYTTTQTIQQESQNTEKYPGATRQKSDELEALKQMTLSQQETINKLKAMLEQSENQVALNLPSRVEFARNSAEIVSADIQDFLRRMSQLALKLPPQVKIEIRGYTDNSDTALRSYELGYERAKAVLKYFLDGGVSVKNLSVKSYGLNNPLDNDPKAAKNNRAEIYFHFSPDDDGLQKSVLDLINDSKR
ncbi:flagellar motor protein MotB [Campylobacter sp. LR264d]|uniref:flagellar motor protein MotB n=1 Tax=Campylobacter sp. LR264d TaxID=2593544 RepID=UPI00123B85B6|nr:flagellar motor protein MotB [Campylobacter sp. LR264d]KAA6234517.1 flagellar motor protein MotB [Campylobacter sp. LR264d]